MIEFLSSGSWINPQIDFLVSLQNIRIAHFEMFNKFFLSITVFGEFWLPTLISAIIYWCFDAKIGTYLFSTFGLNLIFTQLFKMIACVYRPWILSNKVKPVKEAITYALGYSFPSGHSASASAIFGGIGLSYKKHLFIPATALILFLLVGFSRMWLGVHTPQDVIVGFSIGISLVFVMNFLINWAEKNKNRYLYLLLIINIFTFSALFYICYFNQYPIDYINGKLLVNPANALYASIICYGFAIGLINGCLVTRSLFPFDAKMGSMKSKITRGFIGAIIIYLILNNLLEYIFCHILDYKIAIFASFFLGFFITAIYPFIFTKLMHINKH